MAKIKTSFEYLRNNSDRINKIVPYFLLTYFVFICFPYIFARVPALNNVFTNSTIAFILRFGFLGLYTLFGIVVMISNRLKVNWIVVISSFILLLLFVLTAIISPCEIIYYSFYFTGKISVNSYSLGVYANLVHIARFGGDLVFFFFLFCAYPYTFKERNQFTYVLLPAIIIGVIGVLYSLIFERSSITTVLNGGNPELVKSIFHSKNAYGIFLFNGAAATTFVFFADSRRWTKFLAILLPIFLIMSFIINCKLAAICILILLVLSYAYAVFRYFRTRPYFSYTLLAILIVLSLGILLIFVIPSLHNSGFLAKIYDKVISSLSDFDIRSFLGRMNEWAMVPRMTNGIYRWIGFGTATGYQLITAYTSINGATSSGVYDLHNAYVDFYAYHGIIGCIILGLFYIYIGYLIYKLFRKNKSMALLVSMIFFVSILFGMAETYRLFLSMSANTFALNVMILGVLSFELKDDETIFRPNIHFIKLLKKDKEATNNA